MDEIENIKRLAKLMDAYGVGLVVIAFFIVCSIIILVFFIKTVKSLLGKLFDIHKEFKDFTKEETEALNNLSKSITVIIGGLDSDLKRLESKIERKKSWDLESYKERVEDIMKNSTYKIKDYVDKKIDNNGLYEYKSSIKTGVRNNVKSIVNAGREKIKKIPYKTEFDAALFQKTEIIKDQAIAKIINILDVPSPEYSKEDLRRKINDLAEVMRVSIEDTLEKMCEEEGGCSR